MSRITWSWFRVSGGVVGLSVTFGLWALAGEEPRLDGPQVAPRYLLPGRPPGWTQLVPIRPVPPDETAGPERIDPKIFNSRDAEIDSRFLVRKDPNIDPGIFALPQQEPLLADLPPRLLPSRPMAPLIPMSPGPSIRPWPRPRLLPPRPDDFPRKPRQFRFSPSPLRRD